MLAYRAVDFPPLAQRHGAAHVEPLEEFHAPRRRRDLDPAAVDEVGQPRQPG